jgi:hypothetical protein
MDYLELNKDLKYKIAHKRLANITCGFFFLSPLYLIDHVVIFIKDYLPF